MARPVECAAACAISAAIAATYGRNLIAAFLLLAAIGFATAVRVRS
jgi:hypothetical protein